MKSYEIYDSATCKDIGGVAWYVLTNQERRIETPIRVDHFHPHKINAGWVLEVITQDGGVFRSRTSQPRESDVKAELGKLMSGFERLERRLALEGLLTSEHR